MKWLGPILLLLSLSVSSGADLRKLCQQQTQAQAACNCSVDSKGIPQALVTDEQRTEDFYKTLVPRCEVLVQQQKAELTRIEKCFRSHSTAPDCKSIMDQKRQAVRDNWTEMRIALALTLPTMPDPHAHGNMASWLNFAPSRPWAESPKMARLTPAEIAMARTRFLTELGNADPMFADRKFMNSKDDLLIQKVSDEPKLITAMAKVRTKASKALGEASSASRELEYVNNVDLNDPNSPSDLEMANAISLENRHVNLQQDLVRSSDPAIRYRALQDDAIECLKLGSVVENVIREHPEFCTVAQAALDDRKIHDAHVAMLIAGVEIVGAIGGAALACSTGILCPAAIGAAIAVGDAVIARVKANDDHDNTVTDLNIGGKEYSQREGADKYTRDMYSEGSAEAAVVVGAGNVINIGVKKATAAAVAAGRMEAGVSGLGLQQTAKGVAKTTKAIGALAKSSPEFAAVDKAIGPALDGISDASKTNLLAAAHAAVQRGKHSADEIAELLKTKVRACTGQQ